ncbi:MAG: type II 3-dehydroquinate dehydratase [Actinobacteria bacterium]|jgi:3-dehydroquinate dehydratase-2|nr:type II 3-dehydroquinate dehydratase [Actinomycetota bacterium]
MKVRVLNGPNLAQLGSREPDVYGHVTYADLVELCEGVAESLGLDVTVEQTDHEGVLVGWLHEAAAAGDAVVLNPAAFTHYSYAVRDACAMLQGPLVEVHLTNPASREEFRQTSVVSAVASGVVSGFGVFSYVLALQALAAMDDSDMPAETNKDGAT